MIRFAVPACWLLATGTGAHRGTCGERGADLGISGVFAAQLAMGDSWRVGVDPAEHVPLVTAGPFRLVRNPIFTAEAVAFGGFALMVPNPAALASGT